MIPHMISFNKVYRFHVVLRVLLSIGLCLLSAKVLGAPIIIDDFSTAQSSLLLTFPPAGTNASSSVSGAGILGGERDLSIGLTAGIVTGNTLSAAASSGFLSYSQDATISGTVTCQWDGTDGMRTLNPTGLGGRDLTAGGTQDAFALTFVFDDLPANLSLSVHTNAGNASTVTVTMPGLIFSSTKLVVPFSTFTPTLGTGANFSNVGAISLTMGSNVTGPDIVLDSLQTTPIISSTMTVALRNDVGGDTQVNPGDTLRYTVVLRNADDSLDASATGVTFAVPAPADTTLVSGSVTTTQGTIATGNGNGDTAVNVNVGTMADGASVTIQFDVLVNASISAGVTQITNQGTIATATSTGVTDDPNTSTPDDLTMIAVISAPVLSATLRDDLRTDTNSDGKLNPGDTVRYTAVVTNSGNQAASGFHFISTLDPKTSLVTGSVVTTAGSVSQGNTAGDTQVAVVLGTIPGAGGTVSITFDVALPTTGVAPRPTEITAFGTVSDGSAVMVHSDDPDTAAALDSTLTPVSPCGNGAVDAGETCDDGNITSGDGCSASCTVESAGSGHCGNGVVDADESCDDGNHNANDGCSDVCTREILGGGGLGCAVSSQAGNSAFAVMLLLLACLALRPRRRFFALHTRFSDGERC